MNPTEQGVSYSSTLPLAWRNAGELAPPQLEYWQHADIALLHALATIEAIPGDLDKELGAAAKAYERLEAKVDVMLDMLGRLLAEQLDTPPARTFTLWADALEWLDDSQPVPGARILVSLYLSPKLPQPLKLAAQVESCRAENSAFRVRATFTQLGDELADWLQRTVFRYHRRAIQQGHHG